MINLRDLDYNMLPKIGNTAKERRWEASRNACSTTQGSHRALRAAAHSSARTLQDIFASGELAGETTLEQRTTSKIARIFTATGLLGADVYRKHRIMGTSWVSYRRTSLPKIFCVVRERRASTDRSGVFAIPRLTLLPLLPSPHLIALPPVVIH